MGVADKLDIHTQRDFCRFLMHNGARLDAPPVGHRQVYGGALTAYERLETMQHPKASSDADAGPVTNVYSAQWRDLKLRTGLFYLCSLGGFLLMVLVMYAFGDKSIYAVPIWFFAFFGSGYHRARFKCPRCKESFFMNGPHFLNYLKGRCMHCGLKKWSNGE
jgi:hypothetical protein